MLYFKCLTAWTCALGTEPCAPPTIHWNLLYGFSQLALRTNSPRNVLSKVHRWAIILSRFHFVIKHIDGTKRVLTDLLTRWSRGYIPNKVNCASVTELYWSFVTNSKRISESSRDEIRRVQHRREQHIWAARDKDGLLSIAEKIWIPDNALELKLNTMI